MDFKTAADRAKTLAKKPDNDTLLKMYSLYKQATTGDINISQPWAIQVEARAKWDAWNSQKGKSTEQAQQEYIALVEELVAAE